MLHVVHVSITKLFAQSLNHLLPPPSIFCATQA